MRNAYYCTAAELAARGPEALPQQFQSGAHLIYSSPAALAFNSPGAEGFGVKRAALAIPGSVMLLISPGCCGRNTSLVSSMPEYRGRFFYLTLDDTDIVTGRHLRRIGQAVEEICASLPERPSVVMLCSTCADALLGTDMERIARKAEEAAGVPVRPCYMYALTREGSRPPMVQVRQSIYSLLQPMKKKSTSVNLLGFFSAVVPEFELFPLLRQAGVRTVRQIGTCDGFSGYLSMAEANFNIVLHPEARAAAADFEKRLQIPSVEISRFYEIDRIGKQYRALGAALGMPMEDTPYREAAKAAMQRFRARYGADRPGGPLIFAVGECMNGDPFELALALLRYGFGVSEVFGTVTRENFYYIRCLAELAPALRIYSNLEPSMMNYAAENAPAADLAIGKDAGWYHPELPCLLWNEDLQPYGYAGVKKLFEALEVTAAGIPSARTGEAQA